MVLKIVAQLDAKLVQGSLASHGALGVPLFIFLDFFFFRIAESTLTVFIVLLFQLIFAFLLFHHGANLQVTTLCVLVYKKITQ